MIEVREWETFDEGGELRERVPFMICITVWLQHALHVSFFCLGVSESAWVAFETDGQQTKTEANIQTHAHTATH